MAFCRDIPKIKNPESRGFYINPYDFAKIPGREIPKLRKIPNAKNPGDIQKIPTVTSAGLSFLGKAWDEMG